MSCMDDLIAEHCPNGVEYRTLDEIATVVSGLSGKSKADFSGGNARYVSYRNVFTNLQVDQSADDFVQVGAGERQNRLHAGDVLVTGSSESTEEVGMSSVVVSEPSEPLYLNSFCFAIRFLDSSLLLPEFTKYVFGAQSVRDQIRAAANGVTRINISKPRFMRLRIPVPPREVQREIAGILDTFTELEAVLEAELEARRQQYEYYRDVVFSATDLYPARPLGEIVEILNGYAFKSNRYVDDGIRVIRISDVQKGSMSDKDLKFYPLSAGDEVERYMLMAGDLVLSLSGSVGRVAMLTPTDLPAALNQRVACLRPKSDGLLMRYLFHFLNRDVFEDAAVVASGGGTVKNLSTRWLAKYLVPLPPLNEQETVIRLLDKFHALVGDMNEGLPAELTARRQQYEYYRDRLLTFDEALA